MIEQINLISDETRERKRTGRKRPLIIGLLVLYFLGLGGVYFYEKAELNGRLNKLEQVSKQSGGLIAQNTRYKEVIERVNLAQKREDEIKKRVEVIGAILDSRIYWSDVLRSITHIIPDGIWFTSIVTYDLTDQVKVKALLSGKGVKFNGTALSNSRIAEFIFAIENSHFFGNVLLTYSQKREFHGKDLYDFEVTTELKSKAGKRN
ncbi:MAG: PilN domain-containing protein [Deltaproteobacteria bacterium]|nr:PilN domain-containing protein [Deltaproteobacteria bacterium]